MKKFITSAIIFALTSSPAFSQKLRQQYKDYSSAQRCFVAERGDPRPDYCIFGNGKIMQCDSSGPCQSGWFQGKLNKSHTDRDADVRINWIREFYIENGNLIKYTCVVNWGEDCNEPPTKDVYYPIQ